jgi:hypothetical protein
MALALDMFTTTHSWIAAAVVAALLVVFGLAGAVGRRQDSRKGDDR